MENTASSPVRTLTAFQLNRYLDYCCEMLSLIGKLGAIYAQRLDDPVALAAVDQLESMTTAMSGRIWQKITQLA